MIPIRPRLAVSLVIVIASALTMTGCGRPTSPDAPVAEFQEDLASWSLPLDAYVASPPLTDYAHSILTARCMAGHGIAVPVIDDADYLGASTNPNLRRLFDVSLASRFGYHAAPSVKDPDTIPRQHLNAAAVRQDSACASAAAKSLGLDSATEGFVVRLAGDAYAVAKSSPEVASATTSWRRCMTRRTAVVDLPKDPTLMPTSRQKKAFGWPQSEDEKTPPLTRAEITAATVDAECRETSGYSYTLYHQEVLAQLAAISVNTAAVSQAAGARQSTLDATQRIIGAVTSGR